MFFFYLAVALSALTPASTVVEIEHIESNTTVAVVETDETTIILIIEEEA